MSENDPYDDWWYGIYKDCIYISYDEDAEEVYCKRDGGICAFEFCKLRMAEP